MTPLMAAEERTDVCEEGRFILVKILIEVT